MYRLEASGETDAMLRPGILEFYEVFAKYSLIILGLAVSIFVAIHTMPSEAVRYEFFEILGLHDPNKGSDDKDTQFSLLRKPDELAVKEYLGGLRQQAPQSPVARLIWNGYLSSAPPKTLANLELFVLFGSTFRYC